MENSVSEPNLNKEGRLPMDRQAKPELLRGTLEMMVLKRLNEAPDHGYGIIRQLQKASRDILQIEEGSLYPALHRLEKRGYLQSEWRSTESNRRAKYYSLTAQGERKLDEDLSSWSQMSDAINGVLGASFNGAGQAQAASA
jgi:transcriptional regulator